MAAVDVTLARRRISDCTASLLGERQFYGFLLQHMDIRHEGRLPAALGVHYDASSGRIVLGFNPRWMIQPAQDPTPERPWTPGVTPSEPWSDANFVAALEHECLHVVLKHLVRHPTGNRRLWNLAEDLVINQQLQNLPRGVVTLEAAKSLWGLDLPPGLHSEGYHRLLQEHLPPCPVHATVVVQPVASRGGSGQGREPDASGSSGGDDAGSSSSGPGPADGASGAGDGSQPRSKPEGDSDSSTDDADAPKPCPQCSGQTLDCHDGFGNGSAAEAEEALRDAVGRAYKRYREQPEANPGGPGRGTLPADLLRSIEECLHRPVNWQSIIRSVGDSAIRWGTRTTRFRPHRRYGSLFPGRKSTHAGKVVVGFDTSGSIGDRLMAAFWQEILALSRRVSVCFVECDAGVHDAWVLRGRRAPRPKGGGGSNFQGVFDLVQGRGDYPAQWRRAVQGASHLIFLTDGDIAVPESNETGLEVFWAVPSNREPPTKAYGRRIPLAVEQ